MPRRPLPVGSWGEITRYPIQRIGKREVTLVSSGRSYYAPDDTSLKVAIKPDAWMARARFRDRDGVTRKIEAWGASAGQAETRLRTVLTERRQQIGGEFTAESRLKDLGDFWLRTTIEDSRKLAPRTQARYREVWETYVKPGVGNLLIRECTVRSMDRFLQQTARDTGVPTAKLCKSVLSNIMKFAATDGCIDANPITAVQDFSGHEVKAQPVHSLTTDKLKAIRQALRDDAKACAVNLDVMADLMLATACRIGEALALRWDEDIDLETGVLSLNGTVVRADGKLIRQDFTKGKKVTLVQLPGWVLPRLQAHRDAVTWGGELNLVFPSANSTLREVDNVEAQWRAFRRRHPELPEFTPRAFRKAVATAIDRGADSRLASQQLGHSDDLVTRRHYIEEEVSVVDASAHLAGFEF